VSWEVRKDLMYCAKQNQNGADKVSTALYKVNCASTGSRSPLSGRERGRKGVGQSHKKKNRWKKGKEKKNGKKG